MASHPDNERIERGRPWDIDEVSELASTIEWQEKIRRRLLQERDEAEVERDQAEADRDQAIKALRAVAKLLR